MKALLRTWLWMLALSLAAGLAIGTCVRREAERPVIYMGSAPDGPRRPSYALRPWDQASRPWAAASRATSSGSLRGAWRPVRPFAACT